MKRELTFSHRIRQINPFRTTRILFIEAIKSHSLKTIPVEAYRVCKLELSIDMLELGQEPILEMIIKMCVKMRNFFLSRVKFDRIARGNRANLV